MTIQPGNPFSLSLPPGSAPTNETGSRGGEVCTVETHGKYYTGAYNNRVFSFNVTAVAIPVVASGLVSKASLYNPSSSNVNLELIDIDLGDVLVTTVVNVIGLYWDGPVLASQATFTTAGVFGTNWFSGLLGTNAGQGTPYSALTHKTTPVRIDIVSTYAGITSTGNQPIHKDYDGKLILPPGHLITVAASTAASFTAGNDIAFRWMEVPTT